MTPALVTVEWCPEWKSWGVHQYDHEGNHIAEGQYSAFKDDAVVTARQTSKGCPLHVYTKEGKLHWQE